MMAFFSRPGYMRCCFRYIWETSVQVQSGSGLGPAPNFGLDLNVGTTPALPGLIVRTESWVRTGQDRSGIGSLSEKLLSYITLLSRDALARS